VAFTDQQLTGLGEAYHRQERVSCPTCGAMLEAHEADQMSGEAKGIDVFFACHRCNEGGMYAAGRNPEPLTEAQQTAMIERYWRSRSGRCPRDRAVIRYTEAAFIGAPALVYARCPICGVHAQSKETARAEAGS